MKFHRCKPIFIILVIVAAALFFPVIISCTKQPTTLVVNIIYDINDQDFPSLLPPGDNANLNAWLFLRLMQSDGTVTFSNESSPVNITDLDDGKLYRYVMTPPDSVLTDPSNLYIFDAYFYDDNFIPGPAINPLIGGDADRFTAPASLSGAPSPLYSPAPHLSVNIQIAPGDRKTIHLTTLQAFP